MIFASVLLLVAVVAAEPPQYRQRFQSQRQEVEITAAEAPYAAAGYRPSKSFNLPSRQELNPPTSYGVPSRQEVAPPATSYGIPDNSYGAPFNTYVAPQNEYGTPFEGPTTTEKVETETVEAKTEPTKENLELESKKDAEVVNTEGAYYVLLPGSQLQRVQFQTENDIRNMAYTARLQYKNEDKAPIFVYTAVPQYQSAAYFQLYK